MTKRIIIGVEDQFSRPLSAYDRAMSGATQATEKFSRAASGASGGGGWRQMATDLAHIGQSAQFLYQTFSGVFQQANQWAQVGISAARNEMAFRSLAGSADDYRAKIDAITRATRGMVTEGEAAGTAYRLQRFGLAETADEMERFMRTVTIVSAVNPQLGGTAEAINQIQLTLSNMSYMRLDQLGVSAGQVRARMAELKAETKGLSDEQAFQTAVMEQLEQQANAVGDGILEINDAQERMQARWRGFKEGWGLKIAQGFDAIAGSAEGAADAIDKVGLVKFVGETDKQLKASSPFIAGALEGNPIYTAGKAGVDFWGGAYDFVKKEVVPAVGDAFKDSEDDIADSVSRAVTIGIIRSMPNEQTYWHLTAEQMAGIRGGRANGMISGVSPTATDLANPNYGYTVSDYIPYAAYYGRQAQTRAEMQGYHMPYYNAAGTPRMFMSAMADAMGYSDSTWAASQLNAAPARTIAPTERIGMGVAASTDFAAAQQNLDKMARSSAEVNRNLTGAAQEFGSLNEKFGISATGFDTDVFNEMSSALNDIGVSGDVAERAITAYQLATGMATGSSIVFDERLSDLTQQLADGKLSVDEYTTSVMNLGQQDLSWVDRYAQQMAAAGKSTDEINTAMQALADNWQKNFAAQGKGTASTRGGEAEEAGGDPFALIQRGSEQALQSVQTFSTDSQAAFNEFSSVATQQVGVIDDALTALDGRNIHITAMVDIQTAIQGEVGAGASSTAAGQAVGRRALGGPVMPGHIYEVNEGDIPELYQSRSGRQYMLTPRNGGRVIAPRLGDVRGGGSGGGEFVPVHLYLDSREVAHANAEARRKAGAWVR